VNRERVATIARRALIGLGILAVLLVAGGWFLLATVSGARLALGLVDRLAPIQLGASEVSGKLTGPLLLTDLRLGGDFGEVRIERLFLEWSPTKLIGRRLDIDSLGVSGLEASLRQAVDTAEPEQAAQERREPFRPPVRISVRQAVVEGAAVEASLGVVQNGRLSLSGTEDDYRFDLTAELQPAGRPQVALAISAHGDLDGLRLQQVSAELPRSRAVARGVVSWYPELSWRMEMEIDSLAPENFMESPGDWPGRLSMRAQTRGRLTEAGPAGTLSIDTLYGSLRDQPVAGHALASADGPRTTLSALVLHWGSLRADVAGSVADSVELDAEIHAPDLAALLPAASGPLHVSAEVRGHRSAPRLTARLTAGTIAVGDHAIEGLTGEVDLDLDDLDTGRATVQARSITVAGEQVADIALSGRGTRGADGESRFAVEEARAALLSGHVRAQGWFAWQPRVEWDLSVAVESLAPGDLMPDPSRWPGSLRARARSQGTWVDGSISLRATLDTLAGTLRARPVSGYADVALDGTSLLVSALHLRWGSAALTGAGTLGDELGFDLGLTVPDLSAVLPDASGRGRLEARLEGSRRNPVVRASLTGEGIRYADYAIDLLSARASLGVAGSAPEVQLSAHRLSFREYVVDRAEVEGDGMRSGSTLVGLRATNARLELLNGEIRALGEFTWKPDPAWSLSLEGSDIAPAPLLPQPESWPGTVSMRARAAGSTSSNGARVLHIDIDTLSGTLRDAPLSGSAAMSVRPEEYRLPRFDLRWGQARATAGGVIGAELDMQFSLRVPDLSVTLPDASGSIQMSGRLQGPRQMPSLVAHLAADSTRLDPVSMDRVRGDLNIDLQRSGTIDFEVIAQQLVYESRAFDRLSVEGWGTREAHRLAAALTGKDGSVTLQTEGTLLENRWEGRLQRLDISSAAAGSWTLGSPVPLQFAREEIRIDGLCLQADPASLCADVLWHAAGPWQLTSRLRAIPLGVAAPALPPGWSISGALTGDIAVGADSAGVLDGSVEITATPGSLSLTLAGLQRRFTHESARLSASTGPRGLEGETELQLRAAAGEVVGTFSGELRLPELTTVREPLTDQPIVAHVAARLDDLALLDAMLDRIAGLAGTVELDVDASGTVGEPRLLGELRLRDGRANVPGLGLRLSDVQFTVTGDARDNIRLSGELTSGPGRATITGAMPLMPSEQTPARFRIDGESFQVINTPEAQVLITPDLDIAFGGETVVATGTVRITQAAIELTEIPKSAVPVSDDVIVVGREEEGPPRRLRTAAQVRVVLGNEVNFKGFGFDAKLEGSLLAIEEPGKPTSASGELLIVDGSYKAYGQDLTIERGRVLFGGGPADNPGLDVRAFRVANDGVIAGLSIQGTLRTPVVTLFSEPPMAESEALSYLLLGRPLNQASGGDASMLSNAARSLGLRGGNALARRIASTFGLDEARIESDGSLREASLVAGKYLSPRLYVAYGVGLFEHTSTFRVRYLLSSRWTLVGESGEATSADLSYRLERGR